MSAMAETEGEMMDEKGGMSGSFWMAYYDIPSDRWLLYSTTNGTLMQGPPETLPVNFTLADVFGPAVDPYAEMDLAENDYELGEESYWATARLRFNSSTIGGFYMMSCGVLDETLNQIAGSLFEEFNSGRIIGATFDFLVDQAVGGYYDWTRVSDDGSLLHSATRGVDFNMTAILYNGTVMDNVTISLDLPDMMRTQNWIFGPYTIESIKYGAWEYDIGSETYIWNASKVITWTEQKDGYHYEDGYTYLNTGKDYMAVDHEGMSFLTTAWAQAAIVYDFSTDTFTNMLSYRYENNTWVDDEKGGHWQHIEWLEYEPWPMDGSLTLPYIINTTLSGAYWQDTSLIVNFRGHISDDMLPTGGDHSWPIHVEERFIDIFGRQLAPMAHLPLSSPEDMAEYEQIRSLAIESPVSIVTLTHEGEPFQPSWMFQTDVGETFTVESWLQGSADIFEEIDGIGFFLKGWDDDWGFDGSTDWHQWSEVEIQIRIDPEGDVDVAVYNRTVRTQWNYGEHWEWQMVEIFEGHWESQCVLVADWFWEELTWDFIADDWVSGWLSMNSPNLKMPVHWLDVGSLTQDIIGNDLRVSFDILPTTELPQMEWQWDYFYGDLTWVVDYEAGWGEHTVLGWNENTVYSYVNGTKLYMDEPLKAEIFRNNLTGDFYEREKVAYVEINGELIDLEPYLLTDMEINWEEIVRTEFDDETGEESYYIKFANGTDDIQVYSGGAAVVFNITLQSGTWFLAWGDHPEYTGNADLYSMMAVNGTMIVEPWPFWESMMSIYHEVVDSSLVENTYVTYANGDIPLYMIGWPQYIGVDHYVMYLNDTYEPVEFYWDPMWGYHYWNLTTLYQFDWPWELMTGVYNSQPFFIPHYMTNSYVYTVIDDTQYQLPAPDVPMWHPHDLNNLENIFNPANGEYFAKEYAIVDGVPYEVVKIGQDTDPIWGYAYDIYQIDTDIVYNLTDWSTNPMGRMNYDVGDYFKNLPWTTIANGSIWIPEVVHEDWTVAFGHLDTTNYEFVEEGWLDLTTGHYTGDYWDSQIYNPDDGRGYDWALTMTGDEFSYNQTWRASFLNITLANGTFFYSRMNYPLAEPIALDKYEIDRYYMIDIYGKYQRWDSMMDYSAELIIIEDVIGGPWSGQFFFDGEYKPFIEYQVEYWHWNGTAWNNNTNSEYNVDARDYVFLQSVLNGSVYEIVNLQNTPESYKYNFPSWVFNVTGIEYHATGNPEMIYQAFRTEGFSMKLDYAPLPVTILRQQGSIVYGAPSQGMWANDIWTVDTLTGALDLDGDLETTDDQYYVREIHSSTDLFNVTQEYLDVSILWEPDNATWSDEFYLHSYTGMVTFNWTFSWEELNIWTHADTGASLTPTEYNDIFNLLFDAYGNPRPGYWGISWMFENRTSADLQAQAEAEGWDWAIDNSQEWSWLWWELDEHYSTEVSYNETHSDLMDINLAYQYAGMYAWNDTNTNDFMDISSGSLGDAELTHYWMPIDVDSVNFTTPGEGWGNNNPTDSEYRALNETIDFGVTFENITGEVYPFGVRSYFDWYETAYYGSDFESFDERPTQCLTEEFSIDVHFTGEVNDTANVAEVKFDITVGDWDMFTPGGTDVLEGRSLAVAFYSDLSVLTSGGMTANATYFDDDGASVTNDEAAASSNFTMASGLSDVALMSLGGAPYSWSKNTSLPATVDAQTVPFDTFSAMYVSGGGDSATTFAISSEQFFTVIGFKYWDGWAVMVDPVFVGYISHGSSDSEAPEISGVSSSPYPNTQGDYVRIQATVTDSGGSDVASVKVYDIDLDTNHTMIYDEGSGRWIADILRTDDNSYTFNYQIIAEDNAGNSVATSAAAFVFRDNIDPILGPLSWDNSTDGFGDEIAIVSVTVTDTGGSGVDSVILTYSDDSGDHNVAMTPNAGSYDGTIPNHNPGYVVSFWVTATDADGNSVQSLVEQFTFAVGSEPDTFGPSMSLIAHDPASPSPTDTVTVSADIQDPSGVDYSTLQYKIGSGDWTNVSMTPSGDIYSGDIPAQVDGTSISYRIVAVDDLGNEAVSGEFSYTVAEPTTTTSSTDTSTTGTTTTTTSGSGAVPLDDQTMMLILGGVGGLVLLVVIVVIRKRKQNKWGGPSARFYSLFSKQITNSHKLL